MNRAMNDSRFTKSLMATLSEPPGEYTSGEALDLDRVIAVQSFEHAGVITGNKGLVVTLDDGSEFQITVVQSRVGRG